MGKHVEALRPLAMVALALLEERDMHPYEMYQLLIGRHQDQAVKIRPGTLYHAVNAMAEAGLIVATRTEREGNRPERTTYAITQSGRDALQASVLAMLAEPQREYPEFTVAISEAHNLPRTTVVRVLRERVAALEAEAARVGRRLSAAEANGVPARFMLGAAFAHQRARADLAWLNALIDDLDSGALSWDSPVPTNPKETS